jgi:ferredoxin-NADP reductase
LRHQLRVANVVREAPGVVSIYMTGRHLDRLAIRSGQYLVCRFLTRDDWWRGHPFSISAAPNGEWLRVTVKNLGDDTARLQRLQLGTRVYIEGPYGALTGARRTRSRVLLIAGGIGITPLRALLEELPARPGDLTLIYRARRDGDVVFRSELDAIARLRGITVHYLVGRRDTLGVPKEPLGPASLAALVPDVDRRDVYVCGPTRMMDATRRSLQVLGVPAANIHSERFAY